MKVQINKNSLKLKFLILPFLGLLFLLGLFIIFLALRTPAPKIRNFHVTNISANSATISWVTEDATDNIVYYGSDNKWMPVISILGKTKAYDDRDIEQNQEGEYKLTQNGVTKRFTHHVTIRDLEPETEYYFRIGNSIKSFHTEGFDKFTTAAVNEDLYTPDPIYGKVVTQNFADEAPKDGVVYYSILSEDDRNKPISITKSTTLNDSSAWAGDISMMLGENGKYINIDKNMNFVYVRVYTEKGDGALVETLKSYKPLQSIPVTKNIDTILPEVQIDFTENKRSSLNLKSLLTKVSANACTCSNGVGYGGLACNSSPNDPNWGNIFSCNCTGTAHDQSNAWIAAIDCDANGCNADGTCKNPPGTPINGSPVPTATQPPYTGGEQACGTSPAFGCEATEPWLGGSGNCNGCNNALNCGFHYQGDDRKVCCGLWNVQPGSAAWNNFGCGTGTTTPVPTTPPATNVPTQQPGQPVYSCPLGYCRDVNYVFEHNTSNPERRKSYDSNYTSSRICCGAANTNRYYCGATGWTWVNDPANCYEGTLTLQAGVTSVPVPVTPDPSTVTPPATGTPTPETPVIQGLSDGLGKPTDTLNTNRGIDFTIPHPGVDFTNTVTRNVYATLGGKVQVVRLSDYNYGTGQGGVTGSSGIPSDRATSNNQDCEPTYAADGISYDREMSWSSGLGYLVIICHSDVKSIYAHLESIEPGIQIGTMVGRGQKIGTIGCTGNCTGNHLHFELRQYRHFSGSTGWSSDNKWYGNPAYVIDPSGYWSGTLTASVPATTTTGGQSKLQLDKILSVDKAQVSVPNLLKPVLYELSLDSSNYKLINNKVLIPEEYTDGVRLVVYVDENNDGVWQSTEPTLNAEEIKLSVSQTSESYNYTFDFGWNPVAFPFVPSSFTKASELVAYLNSQGVIAVNVSKYTSEGFISYIERDGQVFSDAKDNFPILPGEGYFIQTITVRKQISIAGKKYLESIPINLSKGWNLINLYNPGEEFKAENILLKCEQQGIACDTLAGYKGGLYSDLVVRENNVTYGNDFSLLKRKSYFIRSDTAKRFTP